MSLKNIPKRVFKVYLLILLLLGITFSADAQKINLNLKDVPIKIVLNEITSQTGYNFLYSNALSGLEKKVSIEYNSQNESIHVVLNKIFSGTGIIYTVKGKQIALHNKDLKVGSLPVMITGTVTDETDEVLPGVTIENKTTGKLAASEYDGKYTIEAREGDQLKFSSIGMATGEAVVGKGNILDIKMKADAIALEDVIVTGYQTLSKERATGAFEILKLSEIEKPSTDVGQRLIGTAAGVASKIDADGNIKFEIRGQTSLEAGAQPLVVVDGFAIEGGLSSLNPNDIESITILKDAAAASIWGAKSANGVIVVTSKMNKGAKKELKVELNSFWKFSPKVNLRYMRPNATSAETVEYEQMGYNTNFFGGFTYPIEEGNGYSDLYAYYTGVVQTLNEQRLGHINSAETQSILEGYRNFDNTKQIKDNIFENPFTHQYNLSVMGSTGKTNNILSILYEGSDSNYKGDHKDKYLINFRNISHIYKWLDFSFSGSFGMDVKKNNSVDYDWSPYQRIFNADGSYTAVPERYYMPNIIRHVPAGAFPYSDWTYNPIRERNARDFTTKSLTYRVQAGLTFKITNGLNLSSKIQYEGYNSSVKNIYSEDSFEVRSFVNETSGWDRESGKITQNVPSGGFLDQSKSEMTSYNWRNQLTYNSNFSDRHIISFIAGTEVSGRTINLVTNPRVYGYDDNRLLVGSFPNGTLVEGWMGYDEELSYTPSFASSCDKFFSLFANASYTFDSKYTVSGSIRTDASNLITDDPKYRYSPFLSVGLGWTISKENFMKDIKWIDRLLFRATYGSNGNVDKSTSFLPLLAMSGKQDIYINDYVSEISSYGNPNLRWERTNTLDIGIDFDFFRGKLYGKIDYYNKRGKDLIVEMNIPSVYGTKKQMLNKAKMVNAGIEISLGTTLDILKKDITWSGNFNFAYNENEVTELFRSSYKLDELTYYKTAEYNSFSWAKKTGSYVKGYNASALWAFKYAGVSDYGTAGTPNLQPTFLGKDGKKYTMSRTPPGNAKDYLYNMGTTVAPVNIGFTSSFKIYDFDLSFTITGKFGHVFNALSFNYPAMTGGNALPNKLYKEVMEAGPDKMIPIPFGKTEPRYYFWDRFYPYMDYLVQSANHIRFQELNISYNLPQHFTKKIGISRLKVYAQANNLFTITANKYNEDPEYPMGTLKPQAAFTFGLNVNF